ncbi:MAG: beta-lactamase family protein [Bacteroidales bacterium]|nr:beta-lactamase family protein [Bacteroidales bacterium]
MKKYFAFLLLTLLPSCTIVRGYLADGAYGPTSFSYEKQLKDTVFNRGAVFSFPRADAPCDWLDTLHFFNQGRFYSDCTLWEAIGPKTETQGVLIVQNDSIVYEKCLGEMAVDRAAGVFSVTKSVTSLLCGIAVDEGFIKSIDDPVTDYLPELLKEDPMWQKLTVRHLLDMRSGLDFDDTYSLRLQDLKRLNAMAKLNYGHNIPAQVRKLKFRCKPGEEHRYESMTTEILGLVIERATGCRYVDYLEEKVWTPLGMESPAFLTCDGKKRRTPHAFGGLAVTMMDLAKIGRLYLNKGEWDGKRIVSASWIEQSTAYSAENEGYHFCWYNTSSVGVDRAEYPGYYAMGIRGQVLFVNPYKNLVMVRLGLRDDTYAHIPYLFEQLSNLAVFPLSERYIGKR